MTMRISLLAAIISAAVPLSAQAPAAKAPKPAPVKLPPAVEKALKQAYPNATVKNVSKETENGRAQYEVETVDAGKGRDLIYLPSGTLVEFEDELAPAEFPPAVEAAIKARYPKATITKREKLTITKGPQTQYEAALTGAPVKEVSLTADGTWVSPKPAGKTTAKAK